MKTNKTQGILLGLGVLGIGTLVGSFQPAQAAPRFAPAPAHHDNFKRDDHNRNVRGPIVPNRPFSVGRPAIPNRVVPNRGNFGSQTLTGTVTNDLDGNDFIVRTNTGNVRVLMSSGEPGSLNKGDIVRISGFYQNGTFQAQNLSFVRNS